MLWKLTVHVQSATTVRRDHNRHEDLQRCTVLQEMSSCRCPPAPAFLVKPAVGDTLQCDMINDGHGQNPKYSSEE